jgi:hypothetical protein
MAALSYLGLLCFMVCLELIRPKKGKWDFLTLGHLMFSLAYGIPGFLLEADFNNGSLEMNMGRPYTHTTNPQTIWAVWVGYLLMLLGFYSKSARLLGKQVFIKAKKKKYVFEYGVGLLLFASVAIFVYGAQYGGVLNAIANITLIRSNAGVDSGPLVFVKHFMYCSLFASYLVAAFAFSPTTNKLLKFVFIVVFIFSVIVAFLASTLSGGRAILIYYFFGFYLVYVLSGNRILTWSTLPMFAFGALFLLYGKEFFWSLSAVPNGFDAVVDRFIEAKNSKPSDGGGSNIYQLMSNFAFPVESLDTAFNEYYNFRLFVDWIYGVLSFIPEKVFSIKKENSISFFNTQYRLGEIGSSFEIPTGFLAFGVYSMSWTGLAIVTYVYGWIGRFVQTVVSRHINDNYWTKYLYVLTAQVWVDYQQSGDPRVFLVANFWYLTSLSIFLLFFNKVSLFHPNYGKTSEEN